MKQIQITPQIREQLQAALGPDVEITDGFAVFESISLSTLPLPGKRGSIFEGAVTPGTTLLAMANYINSGNSLPLMIDHNLAGTPKGRIFRAGLNMTDEGVELRTLFYVDPTEVELQAKINNGTYDEVSVTFLAEKLLCSECSWDYRGEGSTWENLMSRMCAEGHEIGTDGVHLRLTGLEEFVEISLVARGAADNPKIVGKSASKLAPETQQRLAAQGFTDSDALLCRASTGEDTVSNVDVNKLIADFGDVKGQVTTLTASVATLTAAKEAADAQVVSLTGERDAATADVTRLTDELTAAKADSKADEATAGIAYLSKVLENVRVAAGKDKGTLPGTVAELTAAIDEETSQLTAILPVGGVSNGAGTETEAKAATANFSAFKINSN